jgi:hypothetical protein
MSTIIQQVAQRRQPLVARWVLVTDARGRVRPEMRWSVTGTKPSLTTSAPAEVALIA